MSNHHNLYDDLGVERTASADEIKAAYRRLAMQHHPDRGGQQENFQRIQTAYDVLSDETKRAAYDATGEIPGNGPSLEQRLQQEAIQIFTEALNSAGPNPWQVNVVAAMTQIVLQKQTAFKRAIQAAKDRINTMEKVVNRIRRKDGDGSPNVLRVFLETSITGAKAEQARLEEMLAFGEELLRYIDGYDFDVELPPTSTVTTTSGWTTSTLSGFQFGG